MSIQSRVETDQFESEVQKAMVGLLLAAGHLSQRLDAVCGEKGLTHDQYNVLRILRGRHPDGYPRYEIAQRLISRAPDVTRLLDRLESRGLVERFKSRDDARLSLARITDAGMAALEGLGEPIREVHREFASGLGSSEIRTLTGMMERLIQD